MIPSWNAADAVYRRAYHLLSLMAKTHVKRFKVGRRFHCDVSDEMTAFIGALNRGDEELIKWYIMHHGQYHPEIYSAAT